MSTPMLMLFKKTYKAAYHAKSYCLCLTNMYFHRVLCHTLLTDTTASAHGRARCTNSGQEHEQGQGQEDGTIYQTPCQKPQTTSRHKRCTSSPYLQPSSSCFKGEASCCRGVGTAGWRLPAHFEGWAEGSLRLLQSHSGHNQQW